MTPYGLVSCAALATIGARATSQERATTPPSTLRVNVLSAIPHEPAFTEGLFIHDGNFYESAALPSRVLLYRASDGQMIHDVQNRNNPFAEGLAIFGDSLIQLTWQNHFALRFSEADFRGDGKLTQTARHQYGGEGWGLCFNGKYIVMSNGSEWLQYRDPITFALQREVEVKYNGVSVRGLGIHTDGRVSHRVNQPMKRINELECFTETGQVLGNVWYSDQIVSIRPEDGAVTDIIDASPIYEYSPSQGEPDDCTHGHEVINGIARDPDTGDMWLTGKHFPCLFKVNFIDVQTGQVRDPWGSAGSAEATVMPTPSTAAATVTTRTETATETATETEVTFTTTSSDVTVLVGSGASTTVAENTTPARRPVASSTTTTNVVNAGGQATTTLGRFVSSTVEPTVISEVQSTAADGSVDARVTTTVVTTVAAPTHRSALDIWSFSESDDTSIKSHSVVVVAIAFVAVVLVLVLFIVMQRRRRYAFVSSPVDYECEEKEEFLGKPSSLDLTQIQMESDEEDLVFRVPKKKGRFRR